MPKYLNVPKLYRSHKWLYQKYWNEMLSSQKIANIVGCKRETIDQWLRKVDIKKRGYGGSKGIKSKEWLLKEYIENGKSLQDLANELKVSRRTIQHWLTKYKISSHPVGDPRKGKYSPLWRNRNYDYNLKYKLNSDGYKIYQKGNVRIVEHREVVQKYLKRYLKKSEIIHHINFKGNDNHIENLYLFPNNKEHSKYHYLYRKGKIGLLKSNLIKEN
jgi:transposase